MKKRLLWILVTLMVLVMAFVGCEGSNNPDGDQSDKPTIEQTEKQTEEQTEKQTSTSNGTDLSRDVAVIDDRHINYYEGYDRFQFSFRFEDGNSYIVKSNATVEMRMVNAKGEQVFSKTVEVTKDNYSTTNAGEEKAFIFIYPNEIASTHGNDGSGTFYYKITLPDGRGWDEYSIDFSEGLPTIDHNYVDDVCVDCGMEDPNRTYHCGDTWVVDGEFELTINAVLAHTVCSSSYDEIEAKAAVIINYTYKNLGKDELIIDDYCFNVFDSNGSEGDASYFEIYCDHGSEAKECLAGGSCTAKLPVALANDGDSVTVYIEENGHSATFEITVGDCIHQEVVDSAVEPTCEDSGLTEGKHCIVCNKAIVEQEEIAALGHDYVDGVCSACGEKDKNSDEYKYELLKKKADNIAFSCAETVVRDMLKNPDTMKVLGEEVLASDYYFRYYIKINYSAQNSMGGTVTDDAYVLIRVNPSMSGYFNYTYNQVLGIDYIITDSTRTEWGWGTVPDDWSLDAADNYKDPVEVSIKMILANPNQYEGQYVKIKEKLSISRNYISNKKFYTYQSNGDGKYDYNTDNNIEVFYRLADNSDECIMLDADYQKITVCGEVKIYSNSTEPYIDAYEIIIEEWDD